jgi:hypothetical protein
MKGSLQAMASSASWRRLSTGAPLNLTTCGAGGAGGGEGAERGRGARRGPRLASLCDCNRDQHTGRHAPRWMVASSPAPPPPHPHPSPAAPQLPSPGHPAHLDVELVLVAQRHVAGKHLAQHHHLLAGGLRLAGVQLVLRGRRAQGGG